MGQSTFSVAEKQAILDYVFEEIAKKRFLSGICGRIVVLFRRGGDIDERLTAGLALLRHEQEGLKAIVVETDRRGQWLSSAGNVEPVAVEVRGHELCEALASVHLERCAAHIVPIPLGERLSILADFDVGVSRGVIGYGDCLFEKGC